MDFARTLEEIEKEKAKGRMLSGKKVTLDSPTPQGAEGRKGETREIVADKIGMKKTNYDRAKFIAENATPEIIEELDKGRRTIRGTFNELKKAGISSKSSEPKTIESKVESDVDFQDGDYSKDTDINPQFINTPVDGSLKSGINPAGLLSKADEEALERNKAFNALSPQKKVIELQRQLKEERVRATRAESELARLKELRHNDVFHKDGIINNLRERLTDAEARIKELEDLYCPNQEIV
jgi:hypothetical protein